MKVKIKYYHYITIIFLITITLFLIGLYEYNKYSLKKVKKTNIELTNFLNKGVPPDNFIDMLSKCEKYQYGIDDDGYNWYGANLYSIKGIKDRKCILVKSDGLYYRNGSGSFNEYTCSLPYEIYSNPNSIDWTGIFKSEYCELNETVS